MGGLKRNQWRLDALARHLRKRMSTDEQQTGGKEDALLEKGRGGVTITGAKSAKVGVLGALGVTPYAKHGLLGLCIGAWIALSTWSAKENAKSQAATQGTLFNMVQEQAKSSEARHVEDRKAWLDTNAKQWDSQGKTREIIQAMDVRSQLNSQRMILLLESLRGMDARTKTLEKGFGSMEKGIGAMKKAVEDKKQ